VLTASSLAISLWGFLSWSFTTPPSSVSLRSLDSTPDFGTALDEDNDFFARPLEDRIRRATIILLVERKEEGGRHKAIIADILKRAPGTRFYYELGDEYEGLSHHPRKRCEDCEGQGDVVFLTGNPAHMRESVSYEDGRIGGLGDITLAELRQLIEASEQSAPG